MTTNTYAPPKKNYLANKDILREIHLSKNSYCYFKNSDDHQYDIIIDYEDNNNLERSLAYAGNEDVIQRAKENRAARLSNVVAPDGTKIKTEKIDPATIQTSDLVFRVMTWDHIPLAPKQPRKNAKPKSAKEIFQFEEDDSIVPAFDDLEDKTLAKEMGLDDMVHVRLNFPPFQHFKLNDSNTFVCVGKSHWKGDLESGEFSKEHGQITRTLATMYLKLCEKYALRFNWRGYCVDDQTEALTDRGWVGIDDLIESDKILSYNGENLVWSSIKSIYRSEYHGNMFHLSHRSFDTLITPKHKLVTDRGLIQVEYLKEKDRILLMGSHIINDESLHSDSFVELIGWMITEGCYERNKNNIVKNISIFQNVGLKADRIRKCLQTLNYEFSESIKNNLIKFRIFKKSTNDLLEVCPDKNITMNFITSLSQSQKLLLIETMIDADGWRRGNNSSYVQKCNTHTDMFVALCTLAGIRTTVKTRSTLQYINKSYSYGIESNYNVVNLLSSKFNFATVENVDFHGAKRNGRVYPGLGKISHPNEPTVEYHGRVWCPETEYGCFMARRNGTVYLTGNTYVDEMRGAAILQLTYVGLRFNEAKSSNPFAYYTAAVSNSFCRVLNTEKRVQNIRDDILEMNNLTPSFTRQHSQDVEREKKRNS